MRNLIIYIAFLSLLFSGVSCSDEPLLGDVVENGEPVDVSLGVALPEPSDKDVLSRAVDGKLHLQIFDLMIFAFDKDGNLAQRYYFRDIDEGITHCDPAYSTHDMGSLSIPGGSDADAAVINLRVPSGSGYLMGIANVDVKSTSLLESLSRISTRRELLEVQAYENHYNTDISMMGGAYMEETNIEQADFDPNGAVLFRSGSLPGRIHFLPSMASVQFNINGKGSGSAGGVFTLNSYEFVNLPHQTPMFPEIGLKGSEEGVIHTGELGVFNEIAPNNYSFDLQLLEFKGSAPASASITKYGDRAAWDGKSPSDSGRKHFTNAPSGAPYVIIRGTYNGVSKYVDENGSEKQGPVTADVAYFIFLGHNSGDGTPEGLRDYSTLRNWQYVYNITVNGINDITVEVNKKNDHWRDDVEGDVIVMEAATSHRFDAHYCQAYFTMTLKEIRELYKMGRLGCRVIAPAYGVDELMFLKSNGSGGYVNENNSDWGVHDATTGVLQSGSTSYWLKKGKMDMNNLACVGADWLRFYLHRTSADVNEKVNYTDKFKAVDSSNNPYLLTLYRFLWQLKSLAESSRADSEKVTFTVFAQENYYGNNWNDRMLMNHGSSGTSGKVHWSQFVNVADRKVLLFPVLNYSTDKESSFSNPGMVFAQRSIRTIYRPMDKSGFTAWGTESVEEYLQPVSQPAWFKGSKWTDGRRMIRIAEETSGKRKAFATNKDMSHTTSQYARVASFNALKGSNWTDWMNFGTKYTNSDNYRMTGNVKMTASGTYANMIAACLGRNRDLNGDGKINPAEIRWYVPGIEQLQALYVGNSGLPTEARLYQKEANEGKWVYKHYLSATRFAGDTSNSILWGEEGPSTGQMNVGYAYGLHVRCVRDLGTDLTQAEGQWSQFYTHVKGGSGNVGGYVEIDRLNANCVRSSLENKDLSGVITTFSNSNRPAVSFYYANKLINTGPTKTFKYEDGTSLTVPDWTSPLLTRIDVENRKSESSPQQRSLCAKNFGQGWRTPTITEVAIMYWSGVFSRDKNILSRTRFTFWQDKARGGIDIINNSGNDAKGRDPHSFSQKEFRLRYPWENVNLPTNSKSNDYTQVTGHYGSILCVKDKF